MRSRCSRFWTSATIFAGVPLVAVRIPPGNLHADFRLERDDESTVFIESDLRS